MKKEKIIQVIGVDKQAAEKIELALAQRLCDEVMAELGLFLKEEAKPAKRRKPKKEAK